MGSIRSKSTSSGTDAKVGSRGRTWTKRAVGALPLPLSAALPLARVFLGARAGRTGDARGLTGGGAGLGFSMISTSEDEAREGATGAAGGRGKKLVEAVASGREPGRRGGPNAPSGMTRAGSGGGVGERAVVRVRFRGGKTEDTSSGPGT